MTMSTLSDIVDMVVGNLFMLSETVAIEIYLSHIRKFELNLVIVP